jgi:hypothetical protein
MTDNELNELRQFHAEVEEYVRTNPVDPKREAAEGAESLKLQARFPGEYVAYLDAWDGQTLTRTVLAHDADLGKLMAAADGWPRETQDRVKVDYVFPAGGALAANVADPPTRAE